MTTTALLRLICLAAFGHLHINLAQAVLLAASRLCDCGGQHRAAALEAVAVMVAVRNTGGLVQAVTQARLMLDAAAPVGNCQPGACVLDPILTLIEVAAQA